MSALLRLLLPLIGYFCTATVVTAALGYGYLRYAGRIDDEKMFRIAAVFHDIDLNELATTTEVEESEIPPEESSFKDQERAYQVATLQSDVKQKQLADLLANFNYQLDDLNVKTSRYENLRTEVENYLQKQREESQDKGVRSVTLQMEKLVPQRQAKPLVEKMIKNGKIDTVIRILNGMKSRARDSLLLSFDAPEDIELLYEIQRHMLESDPTSQFINRQVETLENLKNQDN